MSIPSRFRSSARLKTVVALVVFSALTASSLLVLRADIPQVASGAWVPAGELGAVPSGAASVALPDGRVLVAGGVKDDVLSRRIVAYQPSSGAWANIGNLAVARTGHTAVVLKDGRVLIAGGITADGASFGVEIFNPGTGASTHAGDMTMPRVDHAAAPLKDGRVLIVGGSDGLSALSGAEIFDPETGQSAGVSSAMVAARVKGTATAMLDGHVLVAGGSDGTNDLASAEIFDAATGAFIPTGGLQTPRSGHVAVLLPNNNQVLIAGGVSAGTAVASAELYADWRNGFSLAPNPMSVARAGAIAGALAPHDLAFVGAGGETTGEFYGYATAKTDRADYWPGETVTVTGSGWQPGETVTLTISEDADTHYDFTYTAKADANGNITNTEFAPIENEIFQHFGKRFYLRARGAASDALNTFTDGNVTLHLPRGENVADMTVTWAKYANTTCAGSPSVTGTVGPILAGDTDDIGGLKAGESLRLTGVSTTTSGRTFDRWTSGTKTIDSNDPVAGSPTPCIVGSNGNIADAYAHFKDSTRATATSLSRTAGSSPTTYGDSVTFTAAVTATGGNPSGAGSVTFKDGTTVLCNAVALTGNTATCSPAFAAGTYSLTADYSGASGFGPSTSPALAQTVNPKQLGATITAADKEYDGSITATITAKTPTGVVAGDDVALSDGTATFDNKNVGTGKTVTAAGIAITGADADNYILASTPVTTRADINAKGVTGRYVAADKAYDGNTDATLSEPNVTGAINGETVTLTGGSGAFADAKVGTNKLVTVSGASLEGADEGNYRLGTVTANNASITGKGVTATFTAGNKEYDGNTTAVVLTRTIAGGGVIGGDAVTLTGGTATFSDKNAATGKIVTLTGAVLAGEAAGNYTLTSVATTTANITPKPVTASYTSSDKQYDGTTVATLTTPSIATVLSPDTVTLVGGTGAFADKTVGANKPVTVSGASLQGSDAGNYTVGSVTATNATITAKPVTGSYTAVDRQYDGTTVAALSEPVLAGAVAGDNVSLTGGTGSFANKNIGTNKPVTVSGETLNGSDAGNYILGAVTATGADITPRVLTASFTAASRTYDGTTAATILTRLVQGQIGSEQVGLSEGTATFADKAAATGKTVTATGFTLTGADRGNYSLGAVASWTTTADITPATVVGSFTAANKVYNGTVDATVLTRVVAGKLESDDVSLSGGSASFADKNVGVGKTVTLTGATLSGTDAPNYALSGMNSTSANITALGITGAFSAANKVYDGTTAVTVASVSLVGAVPGDAVTLTPGVATFSDKNVGTAKIVTMSGAALAGADAPNYVLGAVAPAHANITPAPLTITASGPATIVIGSAVPVITGLYDEFVSGDLAANSVTTPAACGTNYTASSSVGTYQTSCAGAVAPNYAITYVAGTLQVVYGWKGFLQPINDTAHQTSLTQSRFKTGQTIPAKFVITNAAGTVLQQSTNPTFTRSANLGACEASAATENIPTLDPDGVPVYSWDGTQYHYNWSTRGLSSGRYRMFANLADGTARWVDICLTK